MAWQFVLVGGCSNPRLLTKPKQRTRLPAPVVSFATSSIRLTAGALSCDCPEQRHSWPYPRQLPAHRKQSLRDAKLVDVVVPPWVDHSRNSPPNRRTSVGSSLRTLRYFRARHEPVSPRGRGGACASAATGTMSAPPPVHKGSSQTPSGNQGILPAIARP